MKLAIGIDLGGTNVKASLVDCALGCSISTRTSLTLDGEFCGSTPRFAHTVRELIANFEAEAGQGGLPVGLSAPGLADRSGRWIEWMPGRMHGLEKFDWTAFLEREAKVLNDAHAALLGEAWLGAAKNADDAVMVTLGTGVGGAVMSGGRLLHGAIGRAGHLGHMSIDANGERDLFNTPGSLEAAIGNQTVVRRSKGKFQTTHALVAAVLQGDRLAADLWEKSLRPLAAAVASLINILDPEVIVVGGGIATGAGSALLDPLQTWLDHFEWRPGGHAARLAPAILGDSAGALGAVYNLLLNSK